MTRDLCAGRIGVVLQATVENKRLCMRNNILRSANAKKRQISFNEMNRKDVAAMYSTVLWCLLSFYGASSKRSRVTFLGNVSLGRL